MFACMTVTQAIVFAHEQLTLLYGVDEAKAISQLLIEKITRTNRNELYQKNNMPFAESEEKKLRRYLQRLLQHEPVQYILEEAWFYNEPFFVTPNVLIPRPETEELVHWVNEDLKNKKKSILDIGTGSGCIAVTLKRLCPQAMVYGCDVSNGALQVATFNAKRLNAQIDFFQTNILDDQQWPQLPCVDVIISNPPYIPYAEQAKMEKNVTHFEPGIALFVPNEDPLMFYKAITLFSLTHVNPGGSLYFEIHKDTHNEIAALLAQYGYSTQVKKDMQGIERMIKAFK